MVTRISSSSFSVLCTSAACGECFHANSLDAIAFFRLSSAVPDSQQIVRKEVEFGNGEFRFSERHLCGKSVSYVMLKWE